MALTIKQIIQNIHLPTLLVCSGTIFSAPLFVLDKSEMICAKWAVMGMLIMMSLCAKSILQKKFFVTNTDKVLKTFLLLGIIEIVIALLQLIKVLPSLNPYFRVTGSFDTPVSLAIMLSLCLPICVYYITQAKQRHLFVWHLIITIFIFLLLVSECRTCIIAGFCASFVVGCIRNRKIRSNISKRKYINCAFICCILLLIVLYYYKRDSADGRLLIWSVSAKMIAEKPLLGWGIDGFSSSYMSHQAAYFFQYPGSKASYLADNIPHPFNEVLLFAIKFGILGTVLLLLFISYLLYMLFKINSTYVVLYLGFIVTLIIQSMFFCPYKIPMVWLVSSFVVCSVISKYCLIYAPKRRLIFPFLMLAIIGIIFQNKSSYKEWQWLRLKNSLSQPENMYIEYSKLYHYLCSNPKFLYNFGAWLHYYGYYEESLEILIECTYKYCDYNVAMLIADDYRQIGETDKAIEFFKYSNLMVPCRFLPLYYEMMIYVNERDSFNACRVAETIINKPKKIENSNSVRKIIHEANEVFANFSEQHR